MNGPVINVPAFDPKVAGNRIRPTLSGALEEVQCHASMEPIQVEMFSTNDVKITIDGVSRIVDAFALTRAINESLHRFRGR